jgi:2-polyprenyl-3-methyl-5-hydroxy-6-metoxy-1,4-benzoquinol methylase
MIHVDEQPCDVCGRTSSELLWTTTWPEHRYPGAFAMRRCAGCGLLFNSPRLDDEQLGALYGRNYYFFNRSDARELARGVEMYQRTVALVADQLTDQRSLDIGTGRGYLPAVMRRLGWDARGVEISSDAADYARQRFGLDVFTGTVEQYANSPNARQFPLVTAIDVIEHVPSPRAFVQAIARVVEPGGRAIIDTPNAAARNIESKRLEWSGFNPFHIYLFGVENLSTLLERCGLTVERAFSYHNAPQARAMADTIRSGLKRLGLAGPAARAYFMLKGMGGSSPNGTIEAEVDRAVSQIRATPSWDKTADATAPLARDRAGDNIVVIARRT